MDDKRAWTGEVLRAAYPGIFEIGDGFLIELGVRYRIVDYDHDHNIWYGELDDQQPSNGTHSR